MPSILVDQPTALSDRPLDMPLEGFRPRQEIEVSASRTDLMHRRWRAWARFIADGSGRVDLGTQAVVLDGHGRAEAARIDGMERPTLRDRVHRFNGSGPAGLIDRKAPGKPAKLNAAQVGCRQPLPSQLGHWWVKPERPL